jgi:hypothetical protein
MAMHRIERAVTKATDVRQGDDEDRQAFFKRLIDAIWELPEEDWDNVGDECPGAQEWANAGAEALKSGKLVSEFDEEKEGDDMSEQTGEEEEAGTKKKPPAKSTKKKPPAKKAAEKKPAPEKKADKKPKEASEGRAIKGTGVKVQIKKAILKKPSISVDEIMERLGKAGDKPSRMTVAGIRAEFRHSLNVLKNEGLLEIDL